MELKKNRKNDTAKSIFDTEAEKAYQPKKNRKEILIQLADLLFDLQNDNRTDNVINMHSEEVHDQAHKLIEEIKQESPRFLGTIGKCYIPGCDVHTLSSSGEIIEHYEPHQRLHPSFEKAREIIKSRKDLSDAGILVFEDHIEILSLDGSTNNI